MKHQISAVSDLGNALRDLQPLIRDPRHLRVGRDTPALAMRPREFLGNWLMCAVLREVTGRDWTLAGDPLGGDGAILDKDEHTGFLTEHVFVPPPRRSTGPGVEQQVIDAVLAKARKGPGYARGKTLVVFSEAHGVWTPNRVGNSLAGRHGFEAVWALCLDEVRGGGYAYWVTRLGDEVSSVWRVNIPATFESWTVEAVQ